MGLHLQGEDRTWITAETITNEIMIVHGGHGLTYDNVRAVAALEGFEEFNIGHSIVSRAVFVGLREAVRQMKSLIAGTAEG